MVNASPEPFSNIAVSTAEDVATGGLLALAIGNPIAAALIALILVILSLWLVLAARRTIRRLLEPKRRPAG
jgi:Ca2+/Na+ antiporter